MGGKKGNRTKGNTRPSSSGRTAELLSSRGVTGFVGFSGLVNDVAGFVTSSSSDDVESTVDSDFRLVMKKTSKRDAVTKIKALQELSVLCENKDEMAVKGALPYWPRIFVKLSVDHDRRVREATHQANKQIITRVKKELAPYLKTMMGTWVISMCDPYAPAASAAQLAFQIAFPVSKQAEALYFCKDEIFHYISDILFHQTAKTLSDSSTTTPEEIESKYLRLISSCFKGLKYFIVNCNNLHDENTAQLLSNVLDENKFWKYANHKETEVRIAWYLFAAALGQYMPDLVIKYGSKLAHLTLGHIDESHPVVATLIWETMLHLLVIVEDCWSYVNIQKVILPQLWKTLREGGRGNADRIFKSLLPLLSKIPKELYFRKPDFVNTFFENFKQGILNEKVLNSPIEFKAVIQAFSECLRYILSQSLGSSEEECVIRNSLMNEQLFPLVELAMLDLCWHMQKPFFTELGCFLHTVENQMNSEVNSENSDVINDFLHLFWTNLFGLYDKVLAADSEPTTETILNRFAQFFHHLVHEKGKSLKSKKVSFCSDSNVQSAKEVKKVVIASPMERTSSNILVKNTYKLCCSMLTKIKANPQSWYLNLLSEMVRTVPSKYLFLELMKTFSEEEFGEDATVAFVDVVLLNWLSNRKLLFGESEKVTSSIVNMLLVACSCMSEEDMLRVLNEQCNNQDYDVLEILFLQIINQQTEVPKMYTWLKGDHVGTCMVSLASKIVEENVSNYTEISNQQASWKLLKICFKATKDFEPVIAIKYLNEILLTLTRVLLKQASEPESTTNIIVFVCELAKSLLVSCLGCYQLTAVEELLVCLFKMSCHNGTLSVDTRKHVQETWCLGTEQLMKFEGGLIREGGFLYKASQIIHDKLVKGNYSFNQLADLSITESNALCLLQTVSKHLKQDDTSFFDKSSIFRAILDKIIPTEEEVFELEKEISEGLPDVKPYFLDHPIVQISSEQDFIVPPLLVMSKFLLNVVNEFLFPETSELPTGELENGFLMLKENSQICETNKDFVMKYLPIMCMASAYGYHLYIQHHVSYKIDVSNMFLKMKETLLKLLNFLDSSKLTLLLEKLLQKGKSQGKLSLLTFSTILPSLENFSDCFGILKDYVQSFDYSQSANTLDMQLVQCLIPYIPETEVHDFFTRTTCIFNSEQPLQTNLQNQCLSSLVCCLKNKTLHINNEKTLPYVLKYLRDLKLKSDQAGFLIEVKLTEVDNSIIEFITILADFFSVILEQSHEVPDLWVSDFLFCTICSWVNTLHGNVHMLLNCPDTVIMSKSVFQLLCTVKCFIASDKVKEYAPQLLDEWKDLYFPTLYSLIVPLFFKLYETVTFSKTVHISWEIEQLFYVLRDSLNNLPSEEFLGCITKSPEKTATPEEILKLVESLSKLLTSELHPVQWTAHHLLMILMPKLSEMVFDDPLKESNEKDQDYRERPPPPVVAKMLTTTSQIVDTMLADFHVEDCCLVQPYTDSYIYTLSYLFSWLHMLKIFSCSTSEIRSEYALHLQNSKMLDGLLLNLFRLMPNNPSLSEKLTLFNQPFHKTHSSSASSQELQGIACQVYLKTLSQLPALVRQWWNNQDRRTADYVNKFTSTYVSSLISHEEIKSVQETQVSFNNMSVKARPTAREVVATYTMEEITIELVIKLPVNQPLGPVTVETGQRIGVGLTQWRHWMLQLTTFLTHQNGSILDGLSLWKRNVDKRFEGIEECMICFYVLHGATYQLPRLTCRTCKKKFHSACLYKWFSTSQNASCPLCRNLF